MSRYAPPAPHSVSVKDVVESIYQQTGRNIPEADVSVPDIKSVGTFECTAKLHPGAPRTGLDFCLVKLGGLEDDCTYASSRALNRAEVTASFSVVIQRDKTLVVKSNEGKKK